MPDKSYTNKKESSVSMKDTKSSGGNRHENDFKPGQASTEFTSKRQFGGKVKRD